MASSTTSQSLVSRLGKAHKLSQKMQRLAPAWRWCLKRLKYIHSAAKANNKADLTAESLKGGQQYDRRPPSASAEEFVIKLGTRSEVSDEIMEEILSAVEAKTSLIIGVHGMAGVGKTKLVDEVVQKAQEKGLFDEPEIKAIGTPPWDMGSQLEQIKKEIRTALTLENHRALVRLEDIWNPIPTDLKEDLGIPTSDDNKQHEGSVLVVVTCRSRDVLHNVLRKMTTRKYFLIEPLPENEALHLFRQVAKSNASQLDTEFEIQIVKKCGGFPQALVEIAHVLRDLTSPKWEDVLNELDIVASNMYSSINLSFQDLESDELRLIFLLCTMIGSSEISYEQSEISYENILRYVVGDMDPKAFANLKMEEVRKRVYYYMDSLKKSSLMQDGETTDSATVNSMFLDFAKTVATENHMFVARREVVEEELLRMHKNDRKNLTHIFLLGAYIEGAFSDCPRLRLLHANFSSNNCDLCVFKRIRLLDHVGKPLNESLYNLEYIQTLCLKDCGGLDTAEIAKIKKLKSLKILSFTGTTVIYQLPEEIGNLKNLWLLDLRCSLVLKIDVHVLFGLTQLQEFYMGNFIGRYEFRQPTIVQSDQLRLKRGYISNTIQLGLLQRLTALEICVPSSTMLSLLEDDSFFLKLARFKINVGCRDSEWIGRDKTSTIKKLKLKDPEFTNSGIWNHATFRVLFLIAQGLWLDEMSGLKDLHMIIFLDDNNFSVLKHLHIQHNAEMDCITSRMISFPVLESLVVKNSRLRHTFSDETFLSNLRDLRIEGCPKLDFVLNKCVATRLPQLEEMKICECRRMKAIFMEDTREDAIIRFPHLRKLILQDLPNLRAFFSASSQEASTSHGVVDALTNTYGEQHWPRKIELPSLVYLKLAQTPNILQYQLSLICSNLKNQKILHISDCPLSGEFIEANLDAKNEPMMHKLREFCLINLPRLNTIVNKVVQRNVKFKMLKLLTVCNCESLTYLFSYDMVQSLVEIQKIDIINCEKLVEIVQRGEVTLAETDQNAIVFPFLKSLQLLNLPNLARICSKIRFLRCLWLKELKIEGCPKLHFGFTYKEEQETSFERSLEVDFIEVLAPLLEEVRRP